MYGYGRDGVMAVLVVQEAWVGEYFSTRMVDMTSDTRRYGFFSSSFYSFSFSSDMKSMLRIHVQLTSRHERHDILGVDDCDGVNNKRRRREVMIERVQVIVPPQTPTLLLLVLLPQ